MAVAGARTVQQVLAEADEGKAQDLLFTLLAEQAKGKELSSVVAEIAQGVLRGKWSIHVKRLAYDLCKNVPLSDADSQFVIAGIRMDINSADVELCALALRMLAQMPHHLLATLLSTGELAQLCARPLGSDNVSVRAAAVDMLGAVLLVPEVLHAASGSAGMANQVNEHWQALTDALLDDDQTVVAAAVSATTALLRAGLCADVRSAEGFLVERLAAISAARVVSALGAVVHAFSEVTAQGRVDALALLQLLVEHATQAGQWAAADVGGAAGLPSGTILPGLTSLAPSVWGYCAGLLRSGDPAVRLEAARTVLHVAVLVSQPHPQWQAASTRLTGGGSDMNIGSTPGAIPLPTGLLLEAISALLELEDSVPLVEAAAQDVLGVVVDGLPALAKQERTRVLLQLWAGIGRVKNTPARMELWARAWAAVVQDDDPMLAGSPESASSLLSMLLTESYVSNVLSGRVVPPPLVASSSFRSLHASSSASGAAPAAPHRSAPAISAASAASTNEIMSRPANVAAPPSPRPVAAPVKAPEPVKPVKKEKEKKEKEKTRFFGMLKGSGKDKEKEPPPEAPSLTERAAPVAAPVPSRTQEARTAVSAAGAAVVSAGAGARAATSAAGAAVASAAAAAATMVSDLLTSDNAHARGPPVACYGSQRHELAASLLAVVHTCHPAAGLAWQLCADVSHATAHDQAASTVLSAKYNAWQQQRILTWITAARTVLQATAVCMQWEPSVVPAITPNANPTIAARASADFATTVQDLWLQLLQASSVAVRALQTLSKPPPGAAGAPTLGNLPLGGELTSQRSEAQQSEAQRSESSTVNTPHGTPRHQPPLASMASVTSTTSQMTRLANPALHAANMEAKELTTIMKQVLRDWGVLSRAVRARALWVFSHSMDMGPHADEQWEHGLKALQDVLCKLVASGNVARVSDLLGSAAQGVLYRSGRVGWSRDRAFAFDVVAASALCERPDYDTIGLVVGLTAAQAWATRLQDALAACPADTSKRVMSDVVFQAGRLEAVLREFMANADTAASPILREWGKRTMRALAATAVFQHPAARALEEAEAAAKKAKEKAEAAERGEDENGYDPNATIHSSSSSSSDAGQDMGNLLPVSLPTSMYLPGGGVRARPALAPQQNAGAAFTPVSRLVEQPSMGFTTGQIAQPGSPSAQAAGREQEPFKARALVLHGALPAHMAASNSSSQPWGYPFAPAPRASALFYSKRSRRSRTLTAQTWQAVKQCGAAQHDKNTGLADVPALPLNSALRLDSPTFWSLLPAGGGTVYDTASGGHWSGSSQAAREGGTTRMELIELCGPGDPVMLVGSLRRDSSDASQLLLRITAINRSDVDVRGAVVQVVALGPAQLDRRAASWAVPRLSPRDRCTHAFHLRLLGYGLVRLSLRLQLVHSGTGAVAVAPVTLPCRPLHVGLVQHMLRAPVGGTPSAQAFCNTWATLPVRTELTAACVWPGREGAAAALSAMLRSSMSCALLTYVGVTATYQLALAGEAVTGEEVYITVHTQLLPPPASNSAATRDMGLEDPAASKDKKKESSKEENGKEESAAATAAASAAANAAKQAVAAQEAAAADAARRPHALLQICVRSSLPDIAVAIATHPTEFLYDLTSGSAQLMGAHLAGAAVGGGAGGPRPPVHPRLAALEAAHAQSLRALPTATAALLGGSGNALPDVYAQGLNAKSKVSHRFMEAAAAAEWQRLAAQPV